MFNILHVLRSHFFVDKLHQDQSRCECPVPCYNIKYEPSMSYAQLSKFNVEKLIITDPDSKVVLENTFLNAREIAERTIDRNVDVDKRLMDSLHRSMSNLEGNINDSLHVFDIHMVDTNIGTEFIQNAEDLMREDKKKLLAFKDNVRRRYFGINLSPYVMLYQFVNTALHMENSYQTYSFKETVKNCIHVKPGKTEEGTLHYENNTDSITDSTDPIINSIDELATNDATEGGMREITTQPSTINNDKWHPTLTPQTSQTANPFTNDSCYRLLPIIQSMWYSVESICNDVRVERQEHTSLNEYYQDYTELFYKNTNQNASVIKEHLECTDALQSFDKHMHIVDELMEVALNLSKKTSYENMWELILKAEKNNEDLILQLFRLAEVVDPYVMPYINSSYTWTYVQNIKPVCRWLITMVYSDKHQDKIYSALESLQSSIVVASGMRSKHNQMESAISELLAQFENLKQIQMKAMKSYLDGDLSKLDMDLSFQATIGQASIKEIKSLALTIQSASMSLQISTKQICDYLEDTFINLFDLTLPILKTNNIVELNIIKFLNQTNPIGLIDTITGQFLPNVDSIFSRALKRSFQQYMSTIKSVSDVLVPGIEAVVYAIDGIETNLQQYVGTSRIDEQFFM